MLDGLFPAQPNHKLRAAAINYRRSLLQHWHWLTRQEGDDPEALHWLKAQKMHIEDAVHQLEAQYHITSRLADAESNKQADNSFTKQRRFDP